MKMFVKYRKVINISLSLLLLITLGCSSSGKGAIKKYLEQIEPVRVNLGKVIDKDFPEENLMKDVNDREKKIKKAQELFKKTKPPNEASEVHKDLESLLNEAEELIENAVAAAVIFELSDLHFESMLDIWETTDGPPLNSSEMAERIRKTADKAEKKTNELKSRDVPENQKEIKDTCVGYLAESIKIWRQMANAAAADDRNKLDNVGAGIDDIALKFEKEMDKAFKLTNKTKDFDKLRKDKTKFDEKIGKLKAKYDLK